MQRLNIYVTLGYVQIRISGWYNFLFCKIQYIKKTCEFFYFTDFLIILLHNTPIFVKNQVTSAKKTKELPNVSYLWGMLIMFRKTNNFD